MTIINANQRQQDCLFHNPQSDDPPKFGGLSEIFWWEILLEYNNLHVTCMYFFYTWESTGAWVQQACFYVQFRVLDESWQQRVIKRAITHKESFYLYLVFIIWEVYLLLVMLHNCVTFKRGDFLANIFLLERRWPIVSCQPRTVIVPFAVFLIFSLYLQFHFCLCSFLQRDCREEMPNDRLSAVCFYCWHQFTDIVPTCCWRTYPGGNPTMLAKKYKYDFWLLSLSGRHRLKADAFVDPLQLTHQSA